MMNRKNNNNNNDIIIIKICTIYRHFNTIVEYNEIQVSTAGGNLVKQHVLALVLSDDEFTLLGLHDDPQLDPL